MVDIREGLAAVLVLRAHSSGLDQRCIDFQNYKRAAADFLTVHGDALEAALAQQAGAVDAKLMADLHGIAHGELPDGDGVGVSVSLWAERWLDCIASSGPGGGGEGGNG